MSFDASQYAVPVVRVRDSAQETGFRIINATDFDKSKHELFQDGPKAVPEAAPVNGESPAVAPVRRRRQE